MTRDLVASTVIAAGAMVTGLLFAGDVEGPMRTLVAILFLIMGPGLAWVRPLRIGDALTEGTLAVAASLGLETVVATALLATGRWTPGTALAIVIAITLVGVIVGLAGPRERLSAIPEAPEAAFAPGDTGRA